jgi:hypothetical protein
MSFEQFFIGRDERLFKISGNFSDRSVKVSDTCLEFVDASAKCLETFFFFQCFWEGLLEKIAIGSSCEKSGLPDGSFSNQKIPIWVNFGGPYLDWKVLTCYMAI